jgi:hypothetical protein
MGTSLLLCYQLSAIGYQPSAIPSKSTIFDELKTEN